MEKKKKSLFELLLAPLLVVVAGMAIESLFFSSQNDSKISVTHIENDHTVSEKENPQADPQPHNNGYPATKATLKWPVKEAATDTSLLTASSSQESLPVINFSVVVDKDVENAKIFVDNEWVASAPNTISLTYGRHLLRLETENGFYEQMVQVPGPTLMVARNKNFKQKNN